MSDYEPGQLVKITTGGTYQGRTAQVAPHSKEGEIDLLDPFTLKPLARFISAQCISPALEHEREEIENKTANEVYFMTQAVVLRKDTENRDFLTFPPVYQIASVVTAEGGVKLKNIQTEELLLGEDAEPLIVKNALELRPPTDDESRHARSKPSSAPSVKISGPTGGEVESVIVPPEKASATTGPKPANSGKQPFNLRETLNELSDGHKLLARRIGNLKIRKPFKQALAAEKAGRELAADQKSAVELIHAMEGALSRARKAERTLFRNKPSLAAGLPPQEHDDI